MKDWFKGQITATLNYLNLTNATGGSRPPLLLIAFCIFVVILLII